MYSLERRWSMWRGSSQLLQEQCRLLHRVLEPAEMQKLLKTERKRHVASSRVMEIASGGTKWARQFAATTKPLSWLKPRLSETIYLQGWAGGRRLMNPFYFYSVQRNNSELKTSWLAKLVFEYSLSGGFKGCFWGHFLKRTSFGGASSILHLS